MLCTWHDGEIIKFLNTNIQGMWQKQTKNIYHRGDKLVLYPLSNTLDKPRLNLFNDDVVYCFSHPSWIDFPCSWLTWIPVNVQPPYKTVEKRPVFQRNGWAVFTTLPCPADPTNPFWCIMYLICVWCNCISWDLAQAISLLMRVSTHTKGCN